MKKKKTKSPPAPDNIRTVATVPTGFVAAKEFAKKAGVSAAAVTIAKNSGKFSSLNLRWVKFKGQSPRLYIHWEAEGPGYLRNRPREKWPEWFEVEESQRALQTSGENEAAPNGEPTGTGIDTKSAAVAVVDKHSADLRKSQLQIEKLELELQISKNNSLDINEVEAVLSGIAKSIVNGLTALCERSAPLVAAEKDVHTCRGILIEERDRTLEELAQIEDFLKGKRK